MLVQPLSVVFECLIDFVQVLVDDVQLLLDPRDLGLGALDFLQVISQFFALFLQLRNLGSVFCQLLGVLVRYLEELLDVGNVFRHFRLQVLHVSNQLGYRLLHLAQVDVALLLAPFLRPLQVLLPRIEVFAQLHQPLVHVAHVLS